MSDEPVPRVSVAHVVPAIAHEGAGPSYSVPSLCEALANAGADVSLHVCGSAERAEGRGFAVTTYPMHAFPPRFGRSPEMRRGLHRVAGAVDVVHNHSLWMAPNIYPGLAVRGTRSLLVTSPRGALAPWALGKSRWRKRIVWHLAQARSTRASALFHATAASERDQIRAAGLRGPIAILPNGIDLPDIASIDPAPKERRRLLFLGRIHPVKNIDGLLRAWRAIAGGAGAKDWELTIAGVDEGDYGDRMRRLARDLAVPRVTFAGPRFGHEKLRMYRSADLFVLPTHTENFGVAVTEALAMEVPAIVSKGAPWAGLETNRCGRWVDQGDEPLVEALRAMTSMSPDDLAAQGRRGRAWMARDFSWTTIGRKMAATYTWIRDGGSAPDWVERD